MSDEPVVTVLCPTYNHERFIAQCLDGILGQRTSFALEVLVHDDASTDGTAAIVRAYAERDTRVHAILQPVNIMQTGRSVMPPLYAAARGRYLALCEGDDYWIDPDKLARQVALLEADASLVGCFHNVRLIDAENHTLKLAHGELNMRGRYALADLFPVNFIHTPSVLLRKAALPLPLPEWVGRMPMGDWPLYLLTGKRGSFAYLAAPMAAYRQHAGGIWSQMARATWLERNIRAAELLLRNYPFDFPGGLAARIRLRDALQRYYNEAGRHRAAAWSATRQFGDVARQAQYEVWVALRELLGYMRRAMRP